MVGNQKVYVKKRQKFIQRRVSRKLWALPFGSGYPPFRANRAPFFRSVIPTKVGIPSLQNAFGAATILNARLLIVSLPLFCYNQHMVIASIDMKDGHVVQLKNGKDLVLQRDDSDALISEFDKYGEVAIIDLDQALRNTDEKGNTKNTPLLKSLLRKGNVRVGGGIRDVKKARELISLGAEKVIIGSAAWNPNPKAGESVLNEAFLQELCEKIGKQRVIISVDSIKGKIAVKGWTETVDIPLIEGAKEAEKYCSELLFTCVEKEGCMQGTDMDSCKSLREAVKCRVVVAGGVNSLEQIVEL